MNDLKRFETSTEIDKISMALVKLQANLKNPAKNSKAHFGKYTDLEGVINHTKEIAQKHGLTIFQQALTDEKGYLGVLTRLIHETGQYFQTYISTNVNDQRDVGKMAQEQGKLISYYRRYQILGAFFLKDSDDDGDQNRKDYGNNSPPNYNKPNKAKENIVENNFYDKKLMEGAEKLTISHNDLAERALKGINFNYGTQNPVNVVLQLNDYNKKRVIDWIDDQIKN